MGNKANTACAFWVHGFKFSRVHLICALCRTKLYATGVHSQLDQFELRPRPAQCWTLLSASFLPLLDAVANTTRGQLGLTEHTIIISCVNLDADWASECFRMRNQTNRQYAGTSCLYTKRTKVPSLKTHSPPWATSEGRHFPGIDINCTSSPRTPDCGSTHSHHPDQV